MFKLRRAIGSSGERRRRRHASPLRR
jgi:hypothetical protein